MTTGLGAGSEEEFFYGAAPRGLLRLTSCNGPHIYCILSALERKLLLHWHEGEGARKDDLTGERDRGMGLLHKLLRSGQRPGRHQGGFTLTELAMVIAVIGILSAIGIPAMVSTYPDYQLKAAARDMISNLQKAKLEAVKRNAWVTVTFNQAVVVNGPLFDYVIFVDNDQDHNFDPAPNGDTILVQDNFTRYGGGVRAVIATDPVPNDPNSFGLNGDGLPCVTFTARGLPKTSANLPINNPERVRLTNRKEARRNVEMNAMGNLTVTR